MKKVLLVAALAAASLAPAAAGSLSHRVSLSLIPLPKSAIGSPAHALALALDSGTVSNEAAAFNTSDATAATLKKLGRVNGYALEYGEAFSGATGVTDVHTAIEQYRTSADAKRGLAFWKKEDSQLGRLNHPGFAVTNALVNVPVVGTKHFAYLTSYSASNIAPLSGLDEQVVDGPYVLDVIVTAGKPSAAKALAPKLAKKLDARLHLALKGRLHAKPVKLPAKQKAGPPAGGPELSTMALQASDLVGPAKIDHGYLVDTQAISDYSVFMLPAGQFGVLDQEIEWYPTANEANFVTDFANANALSFSGSVPLDLTSLGDGAQGVVANDSEGGLAEVEFSTGNLAEFIFAASGSAIQDSDVRSVAQAAANRIDAAGLGS
ncbi:MAG: hypothetical protein ACJ75G_12930 [Gaiellaceae bacterium]